MIRSAAIRQEHLIIIGRAADWPLEIVLGDTSLRARRSVIRHLEQRYLRCASPDDRASLLRALRLERAEVEFIKLVGDLEIEQIRRSFDEGTVTLDEAADRIDAIAGERAA